MLPSFITNPNPNIYLSNNYLVFDLETTNVNFGDARHNSNTIVYGYINSITKGFRVLDSIAALSDLAEWFYSADFIVCHNTKFEIKWLVRAGIDVSKILFYDTMLGDYVLAGNRGWRLTLDACCERHGIGTKHEYVSHLIHAGICPSDISSKALAGYCENDVLITEQLFLTQRQKLKEEGLLPVFFIRNLTTPVVAEMEMNGMFLDKELVQQISTEFNVEYNRIILELNEITGGINMGSPQQVAEFMYVTLGFIPPKDRYGKVIVGKPTAKFPDGLPKTDEEAINSLVPRTKQQKRFIELKQRESVLRKKITAYANRFVDVCENHNSLLQGDFNQSITQTHRLSSSKPNLQNIDRKLKKVVTARRTGWSILSADYAGLEFRVGGDLSKDPQVLDDIRNKYDVHSFTASIVYPEEWKVAGSTRKTPEGDEVRSNSKQFTFGPMYGKVSGTPEQVKYFDAFRSKYHVMTSTQNAWVDQVLDRGYLVTVTGLKFYFPGTEYTKSGYVINSTNIKNYPIQMFATADIAPTGVVLLWHNMKDNNLKSFLIAEVHDSAIAEVKNDEVGIMKELTTKCMAQDIVPFFKKVINYDISFPMEVDVKVSTNWDYNKEAA